MKAIGLVLVILGILLCLTCWGAIIGVPMILLGAVPLCSK